MSVDKIDGGVKPKLFPQAVCIPISSALHMEHLLFLSGCCLGLRSFHFLKILLYTLFAKLLKMQF